VTTPGRGSGTDEHGNVFGRGWGNMFIHVQRESGLAHRTLVLRPWQVQALRFVVSRWFAAVLAVALLSWAYFAVQTARVPFLTRRITHLEEDAAKIDTLQATLEQLQRRYTQVQQMLSASARVAPSRVAPSAASASSSTASPGPAKEKPALPAGNAAVSAKPAISRDSSTAPAKSAPAPSKSAPAPSAPAPNTKRPAPANTPAPSGSPAAH
jgi:hypothetical protein